MASKRIAAIIGVGPGNGLSFARKFAAEGYTLALCSRDASKMQQYATQFPSAHGYACDVTNTQAVNDTFAAIHRDLGAVAVVVFNAGSGSFGTIDDVSPDDVTRNVDINATGLMRAAQAVMPQFRERKGGDLVVVGATASWRGTARTAAFAAGKAAQRSIAQSLAKHLGPEGIHVSYVVVDGMIDVPGVARERMPDKPKEFFIQPDAIADAVWSIVKQHPSAWTFELDIRPYGEKW